VISVMVQEKIIKQNQSARVLPKNKNLFKHNQQSGQTKQSGKIRHPSRYRVNISNNISCLSINDTSIVITIYFWLFYWSLHPEAVLSIAHSSA
jgi:hypothetical protein